MATATILHDAYIEGWEGKVQPYGLQPEPLIHGAWRRKMVKEILVDTVSGTDTVTVTAAIPAGAFNVKIVGSVTTLVVMGGGGATFLVGTVADTNMFTGAKGKTVGVNFTPADSTAEFVVTSTATDIVLTANAGTWTSGAVRLVIFYELAFAPTA